jgi:hypothetical protein
LYRKISLVILLIFIGALSLPVIGCSSANEDKVDDGDVAVNFNINEPKFKERLGDDDGYAFAIFYGADIHGSLDTCG